MNKPLKTILLLTLIGMSVLGIYFGPWFVYLVGGGDNYYFLLGLIAVFAIPMFAWLIAEIKLEKKIFPNRNPPKRLSPDELEVYSKNPDIQRNSLILLVILSIAALIISGIITTVAKGIDNSSQVWGNCIAAHVGDRHNSRWVLFNKYGTRQSEAEHGGHLYRCYDNHNTPKIIVVYVEEDEINDTNYKLSGIVFDENGAVEKYLNRQTKEKIATEAQRYKTERLLAKDYVMQSGYEIGKGN